MLKRRYPLKKITILSVIILFILFMSILLLIISNKKKETSIYNGSTQSIIEFSATLTETPKKLDQNDSYSLSFDNVRACDKENKKKLDTFNQGGKLIFSLPLDKEITKGDKIVVRVHENYATTHSIPPQIIGNSVISVSF